MKKLLATGSMAPDFTASDVFGKKVHLRAYHSQTVLLVFLRYSGCPWCNLALHRLTIESELLKKQNCEIIAFIQSTDKNVKNNIFKRHAKTPQFPIIADPDRKIYDMYGIQNSLVAAARSITKIPYWLHSVRKEGYTQTTVDGNLLLVPAMFLVSGHTNKILLASYGKSFYEHETFTSIYEQLGFIEE